jgi:hypothetical protein
MKYVKIVGEKRKEILQKLDVFTNLSKKRAKKAINEYNNAIDFANAHSRELCPTLKGKCLLVYKICNFTFEYSEKLITIYLLKFPSGNLQFS